MGKAGTVAACIVLALIVGVLPVVLKRGRVFDDSVQASVERTQRLGFIRDLLGWRRVSSDAKQPSAGQIQQLQKDAEKGNVEAQYKLGEVYSQGQNWNEKEAAKWYRRAAEQGNARAQCRLGEAYNQGSGVEENPGEAVKWFRKAAEQGDPVAQLMLGGCYSSGRSVEKSSSEAVKWYRKAADQGYAEAQWWLGSCYMNGEDVERNTVEGVKWYRMAAEQGYADGLLFLGLSYKHGEGVTKDLQTAYGWLLLAKETRDIHPDTILTEVESLRRLLSPEQEKAARAWAKQWKPKQKR